MANARVSVIIPTYNRAHLIARALASAFRETEPGDEIIVVDNMSTDNTRQVLARFSDRLRILEATRKGPGAARNVGLAEARNELVAFLDSDDEWMPGKLAAQRAVMDRWPEVVFSFSDFAATGFDGLERRHYARRWHQDERSWDEILAPGVRFSTAVGAPGALLDFTVHIGDMYLPMMRAAYVFTSTVVVRRSVAADALRFAEEIQISEDLFCYAKMARRGPVAYLDVEAAWNHAHAGERATGVSLLKGAESRVWILEHVWGQDRAFLDQHQQDYDRVWQERQSARVRALLAEGRTREARAILPRLGDVPNSYRALASLPAWLCHVVIKGRSVAKTLVSGKSESTNW